MQGKNKRENSRRSRRTARQAIQSRAGDAPLVANEPESPDSPDSRQIVKPNGVPMRLDASEASAGALSSLLYLFRPPDRTFEELAGKINVSPTELLSNC